MKSLKARFNGNTVEVIEYAKAWRIQKFMEKYEVRDYIAASNFLKENGLDVDKQRAALGARPDNNWAVDLLDAWESRLDQYKNQVANLQAQLKERDLKIEYLQGQLAIQVEPRIQSILTKCRA